MRQYGDWCETRRVFVSCTFTVGYLRHAPPLSFGFHLNTHDGFVIVRCHARRRPPTVNRFHRFSIERPSLHFVSFNPLLHPPSPQHVEPPASATPRRLPPPRRTAVLPALELRRADGNDRAPPCSHGRRPRSARTTCSATTDVGASVSSAFCRLVHRYAMSGSL